MTGNENNNSTVRAFIACGLSDEVRREVGKLAEKLRRAESDVKWVRPESMHLTLRFLGEISRDEIEAADGALAEAAAGVAPIPVEVQGFGMFPNAMRPRVVWLGLSRGAEELGEVFVRLEAALKSRGFGPADKPFAPHLTLGRVKSNRGLDRAIRLLETFGRVSFGGFTAPGINLYRSQLDPRGAVYTVLRERKFSGPAS